MNFTEKRPITDADWIAMARLRVKQCEDDGSIPRNGLSHHLLRMAEENHAKRWRPLSEAPKDQVVIGGVNSGFIGLVSYYPDVDMWLRYATEDKQIATHFILPEALGLPPKE